MTDRELLEAAARAAGVPAADWIWPDGTWTFKAPHAPNWNPLTDDGDALRLAVKLRICVEFSHPEDDDPSVSCGVLIPASQVVNVRGGWRTVANWPDKDATARRCIVLAAAAIGAQR